MWYTHYFYTNRKAFGETELNRYDKVNYPVSKEFRSKREQFQEAVYKICQEAMAQWIALWNGWGKNYPVIWDNRVAINGSVKQPANKRVHSSNPWLENATEWFADNLAWQLWATNIFSASSLQRPSDAVQLDFTKESKHVDNWFAWALLTTPSVRNDENKPFVDATYESLFIPAYVDEDSVSQDDRKFWCTKTNYYPYDVVVTAVLISLYVIFWEKYVKVSSDWYKKDRVAWGLLAKKAAGIDRYQFYIDWEEIEELAKQYKDFRVSCLSNAKYNEHAVNKEKPMSVYSYKGRNFNLYLTPFKDKQEWKNYLYYEQITNGDTVST